MCQERLTTMRGSVCSLLLCLSWFVTGCAEAVSPSREAYIRARDHGWVEVTVSDSNIPPAPPREADAEYTIHAPYCRITISLNGEQFVGERVFPIGEESPYALETGFLFPVPVGKANLRIMYSGCRVEEGKQVDVVDEITIELPANLLTPVTFDGELLTIEDSREPEGVTLETLDERLQRIESLLQGD